ncbi:MAG: hypothetical protein CL844_06140 [Crocinitomicaceae bacterium]|nr:hypothetical protein [Crocinitomicaceae bacterium]|tara:strand:+ start:24001 stop:24936 length:936 start_codon:yes stop_codon:yes gene_type:complete
MIKKNRITIILVNYNNTNDTIECVKSIQDSKDIELPFIIIVDNCSNIKIISDDFLFYPNLKIIYNKKNIGFGRANNVGIEWVKKNLDFEYLLLLNNDTIIEPETIKALTLPFSKDKSIGITTSKTYYENNRNIIWYGGGEINYKRGWPKITDFNKSASKNGANTSRYVTFISGCTMMFSRESIIKLRGFDNNFFMYCEDLELCIRAKKNNLNLYYEASSIVYHKVQNSIKDNLGSKISGLKKNNPNLGFLFYNMKTNQYATMKKHFKGYDFFIFCLLYWIEFFFKIFYFVLNGRFDMIKVGLKTIKKNIHE